MFRDRFGKGSGQVLDGFATGSGRVRRRPPVFPVAGGDWGGRGSSPPSNGRSVRTGGVRGGWAPPVKIKKRFFIFWNLAVLTLLVEFGEPVISVFDLRLRSHIPLSAVHDLAKIYVTPQFLSQLVEIISELGWNGTSFLHQSSAPSAPNAWEWNSETFPKLEQYPNFLKSWLNRNHFPTPELCFNCTETLWKETRNILES